MRTQSRVFHPQAATLVPAIISALSNSFYKINSEALVVLHLLGQFTNHIYFNLCTNNIYEYCFVRLKVRPGDVDALY